MDGPKDTIETSAWSDRELSLRIYYQVVETNGTVRQHSRDLYGVPESSTKGMKQQVAEHEEFCVRMRTGTRIFAALAGAAMTLLTTMLVLVLEHVL